uniref:RRM domain-containing protein n=1 Tax=Alexandrium monilatum TaxID=311494 RepID=A0A7S4R261_9DINO
MAGEGLRRKRRGLRKAGPPAAEDEEAPADSGRTAASDKTAEEAAEVTEEDKTAEEAAEVTEEAAGKAAEEAVEDQEKEDRRGIIHLASVPPFMKVQKLRSCVALSLVEGGFGIGTALEYRHLMEKFGEVGRIYLAPEAPGDRERRKRLGGNKKILFTEGWVEFADRRLAKRVAATLNGGPIGGKKRHNFWRDDHWNMRYLPKFKWHQLKEGKIYARQVRKARLEQRLGQARRANNFYLEQVEQAKIKKRMAEKREKKGTAADAEGAAKGEGPSGSAKRRKGAAARAARVPAEDWEMPDRMLESLIW